MSEDTAIREEIEELPYNGWNFRVKTIKGKQYLSARKGIEEKGLGLYTQDLRDRIAELSKPKQSIGSDTDKPLNPSTIYNVTLQPLRPPWLLVEAEFSRNEIEGVLFDIKFEMARVKTVDCQHS